MNQQHLDEIKARVIKAHSELYKLCDGGKFTMCVPVQSTDTDIVINNSLNDVEVLIDEVRRLCAVLEGIAATNIYLVSEFNLREVARKALEDQHD